MHFELTCNFSESRHLLTLNIVHTMIMLVHTYNNSKFKMMDFNNGQQLYIARIDMP